MIGAVFDSTTGHLLRKIQASSLDTFNLQAQNNEMVFQGDVSQDMDYLDLADLLNPAISPRTDFTILQSKTDILNDGIDAVSLTLPDPCFLKIDDIVQNITGGNYQFSSSVAGTHNFALVGKYKGSVSVQVHSIAVAKTDMNQKITEKYQSVLHGGFTYNGNIYDSDETSMNMISGAAAEANRTALPSGFAWKTQDNQLIPMDKVMLDGLASAMFSHVNNNFAVKESKKAQLSSLTTLSEILNFDILTGWI